MKALFPHCPVTYCFKNANHFQVLKCSHFTELTLSIWKHFMLMKVNFHLAHLQKLVVSWYVCFCTWFDMFCCRKQSRLINSGLCIHGVFCISRIGYIIYYMITRLFYINTCREHLHHKIFLILLKNASISVH